MTEVQVDAGEVRSTAGEVDDVAQLVTTTRVHDDLCAIPPALPGSRSADAAVALATTWEDATSRWVEAATTHNQALTDAAGDYDDVDQASAQAQQHLTARPVGPMAQ
ncbi:hypothetical protein ACO0LV_03605 [Pseudactinotalea sp. Z1739]|uniref:hypothetical protein n=1 Tax=Pseudactinotalea sp. Z1739 TaxID=3413028 RepID=UPI003C7DAD66